MNNGKYNCIILGAFGCGAFAPRDNTNKYYVRGMLTLVANIAETYKKLYDNIIIAVPYGRDNNYNMFFNCNKLHTNKRKQ